MCACVPSDTLNTHRHTKTQFTYYACIKSGCIALCMRSFSHWQMIKISIIFLLLCVRNIQKNGRNTGRFLMISSRYVDDPVPASRGIPAFRKHTQYIIIKAVKWFFFHASQVFEILCIQRICLLFLWINWSFPFFSIQLTLNQTIHTNAPYSYRTYVKKKI